MAHATADIGTTNYTVTLLAGHHPLSADEGADVGGRDLGPSPHELLCAALGACTAITLRMYAQRKEWQLRAVHVDAAPRRKSRPWGDSRPVSDAAPSRAPRGGCADEPVPLTERERARIGPAVCGLSSR